MQSTHNSSYTQVTQLIGETPAHLALSVPVHPATTFGLPLKKMSDLVLKIIKNDQFTPEQKSFAQVWEGHFIHLFTQATPLVQAKAVFFLGMKLITSALILNAGNRLAYEQLTPVVRAQRELIALLLPENSNVEEFITQREEVYDLMLETTQALNDIISINQETEQLLIQTATNIREQILNNANKSRELLRELAQQWRSKIVTIHAKLSQLTEQADSLNQKFQEHSHDLERVGPQLADEQQTFLKLVEDLKNHLGQV